MVVRGGSLGAEMPSTTIMSKKAPSRRASRSGLFCGTDKCFGFFRGRGLNHRQAVGRPRCFKGYYTAAADEESAGVPPGPQR